MAIDDKHLFSFLVKLGHFGTGTRSLGSEKGAGFIHRVAGDILRFHDLREWHRPSELQSLCHEVGCPSRTDVVRRVRDWKVPLLLRGCELVVVW